MPSLTDVYSRHAHFIERYKTGQYNKLKAFLDKIIKGLSDELLKTQSVISQTRIDDKLKLVEAMVKKELSEFNDQFENQLRLFAESEVDFGLESIKRLLSGKALRPSKIQLWSAVTARPFNNKLLKDSLKEFTVIQARMVRDAVSTGFFEGKSTQEIVRGIVGTRINNYKDGVLQITRSSASRLIRTSINHTASTAKDRLYQENSDSIKYYEWISTLDSRTSLTCMSLDGRIFKVGKGKLPPAHFNCRSTTSPLFKDDIKMVNGFPEKIKKGIEKNYQNYNDWLGKQAKTFQIEALGPNRAALFRKGGLSVDKFTDRLDAPLNLAELKAKYPLAWEKSGI